MIHDAFMSTTVHGRNAIDEKFDDYPLGVTGANIPEVLTEAGTRLHTSFVDAQMVPDSTTARNIREAALSPTETRYVVYQALR